MSRRLLVAVLALTFGGMVMFGAVSGSASAATSVGSADSVFLSLVNGLRAPLGFGSLSLDPQMSDIARGWSTQMASRGAMSHNPSLSSQLQGVSKWGENVAFGGTAQSIFSGLAGSTEHLRNMTDPQFNKIGIGTVLDAHGQLWTTHVFARTGSVTAPTPSPGASPAAGTSSSPSRSTAPTTAAPAPAPTASPPTTAVTSAPTTTVPATPVTSAPGASSPRQSEATTASPAELAAANRPVPSNSAEGAPVVLLAVASLLSLLSLGGAGFVMRRRMTSS